MPNKFRTFHTVPEVRIHSAPPASLRFEAFSGEVRKLRVWWRCARPIGTGERSNGAPLRVTSICSLVASNSVPMPDAGERIVRAGTTGIASYATSTSSFRWEKDVGLSIAF